MDPAEMERIARASVEAFNRADWDRWRADLAPDVVYEESGTGRRVEGVEAYTQAAQGWRAAIPDLTGEVLGVVASGDVAAFEVRWTGSQTGPLDLGGTTLPPTGRTAQTVGCFWVTYSDGRVAALRNHQDLFGLLSQLGVLPPPAG